MSRKKISIEDFREGTKLWLRTVIIFGIAVIISYLLSKLYFFLGLIYYVYLFILASPSFIFESNSSALFVGIIIPLFYSFILVNYFYLYFKKKKTVWWLTTTFIIATILYVVGIILGWLTFLIWHP